MPSERSLPAEPSTRWILVPAFRRAVVDCWGQDGRAKFVANLSGESLHEFEHGVARDWIASRHIIAWGFAAWEGPANRVRDDMAAFVRRQWDLSFGIVRRLLLHMAHPAPVVARLGQIYKQDNVGGELSAKLDEGGQGAAIVLTDNPFVETPHGRASMAEVYRHAFAQTRAKNVTETHALDGPRTMVIRLKWTI